MSTEQPRKRMRLDSEDPNVVDFGDASALAHNPNTFVPRGEPPRHEKFWFEDGSIVLIAGDVAFRVHASVLSRESPVFRDAIKASLEVKAEDMNNCQCPALFVSETAQDLSVLLSLLYPSASCLSANSSPMPFSEVASLIRMGHKYGIHPLRDDALRRLKSCIPSELTEDTWNNFCSGQSSMMTMQKHDFIAVVNLARLTNTPSLLPMALYACCTVVEPEVRVSGVVREDGVLEQLSREDLVRCFRGIANLVDAKETALRWLLKFKPKCATPVRCAKRLRSLPSMVNDVRGLVSYAALDPVLLNVTLDEGLCSACRNLVTSKDEEARQLTFSRLPSLMDVTVDNLKRE